MKPNKKKPRIRNRPRNKANRLKSLELHGDEPQIPIEGKEEEEIAKVDDNIEALSSEDDDMPDLEDEVDTSKLLYCPEKDEAIKKIQQLINAKNTAREMSKEMNEIKNPKENITENKTVTNKKTTNTNNTIIKNETTKNSLTNAKIHTAENENNSVPIKQKEINNTGVISTVPIPETNTAVKTILTAEPNTKVNKAQKENSPAEEELLKNDAKPSMSSLANSGSKRPGSKQNTENRKDTKLNAATNQKSSKPKAKPVDNNPEQNAFIQNIQKKMEAMMANGDENLPNTLMENLKKLLDQGPVSDIESDSEGDEYVEYIYKPRKYFLVALCNFCKSDLSASIQTCECSNCHMTYYCTAEHMQNDAEHRELCQALQQVAAGEDGHIFQKCSDMSADQFRSYRIITIRKVEHFLQRPLSATEQEVILFPRLCLHAKCRQYAFELLNDCPKCGMVAFCKEHPEHLSANHEKWCNSYQLFKEFIIFQEQFGKLDPSLPTKILKDTPLACNTTKQIFSKLGFDIPYNCEYAALTQISTAPLTAWYALKLCEQLKLHQDLTVHLIGAEIEFEVDVLHKWELFFLHITPTVKNLNVVFVGPELNPNNILLEQFQKTKCCIGCRKNNRNVKYFFESNIYHDYCKAETFLKPNLICFFNAGLYRSTGYNMEDTWPDTIAAAASLHVPTVVTAYTEYESPLDMQRFTEECQREVKIIQAPDENPFASVKPERNFISDNEAPLMFKNFFYFVIE